MATDSLRERDPAHECSPRARSFRVQQRFARSGGLAQQNLVVTVNYSTHGHLKAEAISDRRVVMRQGPHAQIGAAALEGLIIICRVVTDPGSTQVNRLQQRHLL